jgi:Ni/Fe-hydrogenase 1 B-type cytochrome subunit
MTTLKTYFVWDPSIRWFHWINLLCMIGLIGVGVVLLNDEALGVTNNGKILLKTTHVLIGYAFALNLFWRLLWAFVGRPCARWGAILPGGIGYMKEMRAYIADWKFRRPRQYIGHNPLGRLAVTLMLLLLLAQAATGLVLAGTDLFYPPIGSKIAGWVAGPGIDPATLVPYAKEMYEPAAYESMRAFREPFIAIHYFGFYTLIILTVIHIIAVIVTELYEGGTLMSAMVTGKKVMSTPPAYRTKSE